MRNSPKARGGATPGAPRRTPVRDPTGGETQDALGIWGGVASSGVLESSRYEIRDENMPKSPTSNRTFGVLKKSKASVSSISEAIIISTTPLAISLNPAVHLHNPYLSLSHPATSLPLTNQS
jgi:hypothetical protein